MTDGQAFRKNSSLFFYLITQSLVFVVATAFCQRAHALTEAYVTASIVELADRDGLTETAREVFYLNQPQIISDRKLFNDRCIGHEVHPKKSSLLGCYLSTDQGIFIFNITDKRLNGTMELTAAHELLHAFYLRLSDLEKHDIDDAIEASFKTIRDPDIKFRLSLYSIEQRRAELHSILGTETLHLPNKLEIYYSRFFRNRLKIVAFAKASKAEIEKRVGEVSRYDKKLDQQKREVDRKTKQISSLQHQIAGLKTQLDILRPKAQQQIPEYNRLSDIINLKIRKYNSSIRNYNKLVNDYNCTSATRNSIAVDTEKLVQKLDTRSL